MEILLVEDNETLAKGIIYSLEQEKFEVIHKTNVKETIKFLQNQKPKLVILDISLPDGNGFDLYEKNIKNKNISTIFLTAKDDEDDIVKGLEAGAEDYITKPAKVRIMKTDEEKNISRLEITIHEGKNRQVRKMCESVGYKVVALHRSKIADIGVKDLKLGTWRYLKDFEVKKNT